MNSKVITILLCVLIVYVTLGGLIFHYLESGKEAQERTDWKNAVDDFLDHHNCVSKDQVKDFVVSTQKAYQAGILKDGEQRGLNWDICSSIFFCVICISAIGYGNIAPLTNLGRFSCCIYATIGIPLFLVIASDIGVKINSIGNIIQTKLTCRHLKNKPKLVSVVAALVIFVIGGTLLMTIPAIIFMFIEHWSFAEAMYYCFITLTTIGFGDLIAGEQPETPWRGFYRSCVSVWIVMGLAWMAGLISTAQSTYTTLIEKVEIKAEEHISKHEEKSENSNTTGILQSSKTEQAQEGIESSDFTTNSDPFHVNKHNHKRTNVIHPQ